MDPTQQALTWLYSALPEPYAGDLVALVSFAIASCALTLRFWRPPHPGSHWVVVYTIISAIGQARGWNVAAYQPGKKAVMVPADTPRAEVAAKLGLHPDETRPGKVPKA
ncbi:hypothetical protein [Acetobacter sp. UBA5411]|uniref:hypothetical protein n=1 Tax=Acetobacter sp. UBA5411 TaxID=1945905 RepID=UPI0025BD3F59|nr:hypothetical protein [Acetobacter sp. UBA5411]